MRIALTIARWLLIASCAVCCLSLLVGPAFFGSDFPSLGEAFYLAGIGSGLLIAPLALICIVLQIVQAVHSMTVKEPS